MTTQPKASFYILPASKLIVERFEGKVSVDLIKMASIRIWEHREYNRYYDGFIDTSDSQFEFGLSEMIKLVRFYAITPKRARGKIAILIESPERGGKVYLLTNRLVSVMRIKVFTNKTEAAKFLRVESDKLDFNSASEVEHVLLD